MFIYPIPGPSRRSVSTQPNVLGKGDSLLKTAHYMQDLTNLPTKYRFRQQRSPSLMLRGGGRGVGLAQVPTQFIKVSAPQLMLRRGAAGRVE